MSYSVCICSLRTLFKDTRGSVLPLMAFGIVMLITAVGVAMDLSREQTLHAKLNAAMDASTLAAAKSIQQDINCSAVPPTTQHPNPQQDANSCIEDQVQSVGTNYFKTNYANAFGGVAVTPTFNYDYTSGNVIGTVTAKMPTTFMQVVGTDSFPVAVNTLTQASVFYLGQGTGTGTSYLNPMTYNDPSTGLYSQATTAGTKPIAAYNGGKNSIVLSANGFDTLSVFPTSALRNVNGNTTNDVVLGNFTWGGNTDEYGPALHFGGITGMNTDDIYLQRQNIAPNQSALIVNVGDDYGLAYGTGSGDALLIGAQDFYNKTGLGVDTYIPNFLFASDGSLRVNASVSDTGTTNITSVSEPNAQLEVAGTALLENNSTAASKTTAATTPRLGLVDTSVAPAGGGAAGATTSPAWYIDNDSDNFRIFRQNNIGTAGNTFVDINNAGYVGVGTQTPNCLFEVGANGGTGTTCSRSANAIQFNVPAQMGTDAAPGTLNSTGWLDANIAFSGSGGQVVYVGDATNIAGGLPNGNPAPAAVAGNSCSNAKPSNNNTSAALAYDTTNDIVVYCNASTGKWTSIAKPVLKKTEAWRCNFNGSGPCITTGAIYGLTKTTASVHDICTITQEIAGPNGAKTDVSATLTGSPGTTWTLDCAMSGSGGDCGIACYDFQ